MTFKELFSKKPVTLSCELFPPKTEKGVDSLIANVHRLMSFSPDFITCTYGAGGSERNKTLDILQSVKSEFQLPVATHLTVVGSDVDELRDYLKRARQIGIEFVVALRGDPPKSSSSFQPKPGGLKYANELVELLRTEFPEFGVAVAGYPEVHQEAASAETDLENLKRKVDAGSDLVITQLFYNNRDFFDFRDRCRRVGINVPIVPGIMPVTNLKQIEKIASLCGARLPTAFINRLAENENPEWQFQVGVEQAIRQIAELIDQEVEGLHFYVLNRSDATSAILQAVEITSRIPV